MGKICSCKLCKPQDKGKYEKAYYARLRIMFSKKGKKKK